MGSRGTVSHAAFCCVRTGLRPAENQLSMVRGDRRTTRPSGGFTWCRAAASAKYAARSPCSRRALTSGPSTPNRKRPMALRRSSSITASWRKRVATNDGSEPERRAVPRARGACRDHMRRSPRSNRCTSPESEARRILGATRATLACAAVSSARDASRLMRDASASSAAPPLAAGLGVPNWSTAFDRCDERRRASLRSAPPRARAPRGRSPNWSTASDR